MPRYRLVTWPASQDILYSQECFEVEHDEGPATLVQDPNGDHILVNWPEAQKFQYRKGTYELYDTDEDGDDGDYIGTIVPVDMYINQEKKSLLGLDIQKAAARLRNNWWTLKQQQITTQKASYTFERGGRGEIILKTKWDAEKKINKVTSVSGNDMDLLP